MICPNCKNDTTRAKMDTHAQVTITPDGGVTELYAPETVTIKCTHCAYKLDTHLAKIRDGLDAITSQQDPITLYCPECKDKFSGNDTLVYSECPTCRANYPDEEFICSLEFYYPTLHSCQHLDDTPCTHCENCQRCDTDIDFTGLCPDCEIEDTPGTNCTHPNDEVCNDCRKPGHTRPAYAHRCKKCKDKVDAVDANGLCGWCV